MTGRLDIHDYKAAIARHLELVRHCCRMRHLQTCTPVPVHLHHTCSPAERPVHSCCDQEILKESMLQKNWVGLLPCQHAGNKPAPSLLVLPGSALKELNRVSNAFSSRYPREVDVVQLDCCTRAYVCLTP